jgi:hypothetical protein
MCLVMDSSCGTQRIWKSSDHKQNCQPTTIPGENLTCGKSNCYRRSRTTLIVKYVHLCLWTRRLSQAGLRTWELLMLFMSLYGSLSHKVRPGPRQKAPCRDNCPFPLSFVSFCKETVQSRPPQLLLSKQPQVSNPALAHLLTLTHSL